MDNQEDEVYCEVSVLEVSLEELITKGNVVRNIV